MQTENENKLITKRFCDDSIRPNSFKTSKKFDNFYSVVQNQQGVLISAARSAYFHRFYHSCTFGVRAIYCKNREGSLEGQHFPSWSRIRSPPPVYILSSNGRRGQKFHEKTLENPYSDLFVSVFNNFELYPIKEVNHNCNYVSIIIACTIYHRM